MIISVLLVVVVLLQFGKGAEAGFFSATSSQGVFAGSGRGNFLTRLTAFLAVIFLGLALYLAHLRGETRNKSVFDKEAPSIMETAPELDQSAKDARSQTIKVKTPKTKTKASKPPSKP